LSIERHALPSITEETKATWRHRRHDKSAGGVAYRRLETIHALEIALIATHEGTRWQLPKGSVEEGETSLQTAIREVEEEAGLKTANEGFLQTIDYWYWDTYRKEIPELVHKQVDFYLLRMIGGTLSDESYEVDSVGWFTPAQALTQLTFPGERAVVQLALAQLGETGGGVNRFTGK
jgi:8-oxo-dGTP pyrophosphatase MutT (NUDIX family)